MTSVPSAPPPAPSRRVPVALLGGGLALGVLIVTALALTSRDPARAQVDLAVNRAMTKGPENAAVTIIEFSDYQ